MENYNVNREVIQSAFSSSDVDGLTRFFKRIWQSDATYKVLVARRAFNLNQIFVNAMPIGHNDNNSSDSIISDTALLLYAEKISDYYRVLHSFPSILIADDILVHGRRIEGIVSDLEHLIVSYLEDEDRNTTCYNKQRIRSELFKSITIYIYAENAEGILLGSEYNVISEKRFRYSELKGLSQQISRAIQNSTVRNTNYVLSASIPSSEMFGNEDVSMFRYRGRTMQFMYRTVCNHIHETARTYRSADGKLDRFVTFSVLYGDSDVDFSTICLSVSEILSSYYPGSRFAYILNLNHHYDGCYCSPKSQVLSFLLSMICYIDFYTETVSKRISNSNDLILQSDFLKIASNFDYPNKIQREIVFFFKMFCRESNLKSDITRAIIGNTESPGYVFGSDSFSNGKLQCKDSFWSESKRIHYKAENIFYDFGLNGEYEAKSRLNKNDAKNSITDQYINFQDYFKKMNSGDDDVSEIQSLGCLLNLMDSGLFGTYFAFDKKQDKTKTYLKAGELSTFSLPRRFSAFIPALAEIESFAEKNDYDVDDLIVLFVDYLIDNDFYHSRNSQFEADLLEELRNSVYALLYMRQAGQKFRDWDVSLLTKEDMESFGLNDDGTYSIQRYYRWVDLEPKLERHYAFCTKAFLRSLN